jgi:hypothetical protein
MKGDHYGVVIRIVEARVPINDKRPDIAHVKLDKSGTVTRVLLDDCTRV